MSCLEEQEVIVEIDLPEWHEFETWYESRTGQSSFMQMCRVINYLLGIYDRDVVTFYRVGSNPGDTDFAAVAYEANPTWNPLYDIQVILTQCRQAVYDILNTEDPSTDCTVRMPTDRSSILATYIAAIAGLNLALKEDWLPLLTAMRNAIQGISISTQTILAMSEATYNMLSYTWLFRAEIFYHWGLNDPSARREVILSTSPSPTSPRLWQLTYGIAGEAGLNQYSPLRAAACSEYVTSNFPISGSGGVGASFYKGALHTIGGTSGGLAGEEPDRFNVVYWSDDPHTELEPKTFCESGTGGEFSGGVPSRLPLGWVEERVSIRTVRISRSGSAELKAATDGFAVDWHIEPSTTDVTASFSPSSGTHYWAPGQDYVDIEITTTLIDANLVDLWPDAPIIKCYPVFYIDTPPYTVCVDACGEYQNPLE